MEVLSLVSVMENWKWRTLTTSFVLCVLWCCWGKIKGGGDQMQQIGGRCGGFWGGGKIFFLIERVQPKVMTL